MKSSTCTPTPLPHTEVSVHGGFHVPYETRTGAFGEGLFALEDIPKGALVWKFKSMLYAEALKLDRDPVAVASSAGWNVLTYVDEAEARARLEQIGVGQGRDGQQIWMDHVYVWSGMLHEILDDGLLMNHSEEPNIVSPECDGCCLESSYAGRDIKKGEEMFEDYGTFGYPSWYNSLMVEYGCTRDFMKQKPLTVN